MPSQCACCVIGMQHGIIRRCAFAAPQRGKPARRERNVAEPPRGVRAGLLRLQTETDDCNDRSDDAIAIRKQPTGQRENHDPDGGSACNRRAYAQEHGAAKCVIEARKRCAGESRVEELHQRNGDGREEDRRADKEWRAPPTRRR